MSEIGYGDFIEICSVDDPLHWQGMVVKADGVWVEPPPDDLSLFPGERAALSVHPKKDLTTPALKFPCTDRDLRIFLEWVAEGMAGAYMGPEVTNLQKAEVGTADACLGTHVTEVSTEKKKGGRPKGPLYEAVEFAYLKFRDEGNTEILRRGKIAEFLDRLKDLAGSKNRKITDYIAERIIFFFPNPSFRIPIPPFRKDLTVLMRTNSNQGGSQCTRNCSFQTPKEISPRSPFVIILMTQQLLRFLTLRILTVCLDCHRCWP